jgi:hypothetical protein
MQKFLLSAPSWLIAVLFGGLFALTSVIVGVIDDAPWRFVVIMALIGAAILGPLVALVTRNQRREQLRVLEELPDEEWTQVRRAVWKGPVPSDPRTRTAALELAQKFFGRAHRFRWLVFIIFGLNLVLAIVEVVMGGSRWYILSSIGWVIVICSQWYNLRRLKQRIELLR